MRKKTFDKSFNKVFEASKVALKRMNAHVEHFSKSKGTIVATTGFSFFSWGEDIQIFINEIGKLKTEIIVRSNSDKQLFDWGKSKRNEREFIIKITNILRKP